MRVEEFLNLHIERCARYEILDDAGSEKGRILASVGGTKRYGMPSRTSVVQISNCALSLALARIDKSMRISVFTNAADEESLASHLGVTARRGSRLGLN